MTMQLFVGSLAYTTTQQDLEELFSKHGKVNSAKVISERDSGRSKGFGFVEMDDKEEGLKAIEALNGTVLGERTIVVNEAKPLSNDRPSGQQHRRSW